MSNSCRDYWDSFIKHWKGGSKAISGWSDPDSIPMYNNKEMKTLSSGYIPEPWWGNDGKSILHSVVINYNPGEGKQSQELKSLPTISSYADDIVNADLFPKTNCWHCRQRAMPILNSLKRLHQISGPYGVHNHLSIELIPWHTHNVDSLYWEYLKNNAQNIYNNVLSFAAAESSRIDNDILKSIVLLRMSGDSVIKLLDALSNVDIYSTRHNIEHTKSDETHLIRFEFEQEPNVRFISFWGNHIRNGMPSPKEMDELLTMINTATPRHRRK